MKRDKIKVGEGVPAHIRPKIEASLRRRTALLTLIRAAEDVAIQYETATCGPDLADSIRVFLIPALRQAKFAVKEVSRG